MLQRNFRKFLFFRDWQWYYLVNHTKRFIGQRNIEEEIAELEAESKIACKQFDEEVAKRDEFTANNNAMQEEKDRLVKSKYYMYVQGV